MTFGAFLQQASNQLQAADIPTARLDVLVLMEDELERDRSVILAHPEAPLTPPVRAALNKKIIQRTSHTPLAYIRQKAQFFGREFVVTPHVLVPRPETEAIIELLKTLKLENKSRIADIGTGSGCIGITATLELLNPSVDLYDIDTDALAVAAQNAQRLHATSARCFKSNLLENLQAAYDVLLANLPYVPNNMATNKAARHEPPQAIFAGNDGMDAYRLFWQQVASVAFKPAYIVTESLPGQHKLNKTLAQKAGYAEQIRREYIQLFTLL